MLSAQRSSFIFSVRWVCWPQILWGVFWLIFPLKISLFYLHFWETFLLDIRSLVGFFFSFRTLNMPSTTLPLVSAVSNNRSLLILLGFSAQLSHSSPAAFWDFFFVFPTFFFFFTMKCLGVDFFVFMPLGRVHYVSWMWRLFFHQI